MTDDRIAAKVRALLAKAASTEFPAERDACETKAFELMARHAIDADALGERSPIEHRKHAIVGWGNATTGVAAIWTWIAQLQRCAGCSQPLQRGVAVVHLFGASDDLDIVEALVEHLLGQLRSDIARDRPASRLSYARAWGTQVHHRLADIIAATAAHTNLPVPTNSAAATALRSTFAKVRRKAHNDTDMASLVRGAVAGKSADLGQQRVEAGQRAITAGAL
jgi:hypothetical protein